MSSSWLKLETFFFICLKKNKKSFHKAQRRLNFRLSVPNLPRMDFCLSVVPSFIHKPLHDNVTICMIDGRS